MLDGLCDEQYVTDIQTEMLIYQSRVNLDGKILFGNIPHLIDPEIRNCWYRAYLGTKIPHSILLYNLPSIEIQILYLKLAM